MNHKQKLGYMALGAGILAIGIIIGQWVTPDIEAQSNEVFDKITCREIEVIDKDGNEAIRLYTTKHGGFVSVSGKDGGRAVMTTTDHSGVVKVYGKGGEARMTTDEQGGRVEVLGHITGFSEDGNLFKRKTTAAMFTGEHGGRVDVGNKEGKRRVTMGTDEQGGIVEIANNQGKRIAFLGRKASAYGLDGIDGNVFEIFGEEGKPAITLSANVTNEVIIHDAVGNDAIRLHSLGGGPSGGFSIIQVFEGGDKGFDLSISDGHRSMTVYDPLETEDIEIRGHKVTTWKEAFKVNVSNTRNALQLWGKSPYQKGIGFYGDSNEAKQTTWIPEQEE